MRYRHRQCRGWEVEVDPVQDWVRGEVSHHIVREGRSRVARLVRMMGSARTHLLHLVVGEVKVWVWTKVASFHHQLHLAAGAMAIHLHLVR